LHLEYTDRVVSLSFSNSQLSNSIWIVIILRVLCTQMYTWLCSWCYRIWNLIAYGLIKSQSTALCPKKFHILSLILSARPLIYFHLPHTRKKVYFILFSLTCRHTHREVDVFPWRMRTHKKVIKRNNKKLSICLVISQTHVNPLKRTCIFYSVLKIIDFD